MYVLCYPKMFTKIIPFFIQEFFNTSTYNKTYTITTHYFMLSGRISRNIGENIFRSYTGTTSENTDFHVLDA